MEERFEIWVAARADPRSLAPRVYSEICERSRNVIGVTMALMGFVLAVLGLVSPPEWVAVISVLVTLCVVGLPGLARWLDYEGLIREFEKVVMGGEDPMSLPRPLRWLSKWAEPIMLIGFTVVTLFILLAAG